MNLFSDGDTRTQQQKLENSREIWEQAIAQHPPYAVVLCLSGGNDSAATLAAAMMLGIRIDYVLHVNTRTGIPQTTEWVRWLVTEHLKLPYIEADAGSSYEDYVRRKGFFGVGTGGTNSAHTFAYHLLKKEHLEKSLSRHIRQGKRGRNILLLNGARIAESQNRADNFSGQPIRAGRIKKDGTPANRNFWVNLLHYWSKEDCTAARNECGLPCNPVARELCRSGECMCGTTQGKQARAEASALFPKWGEWLDSLEADVMQRFPWGWGESVPQGWIPPKIGSQLSFDFQPMCSSCRGSASSAT